MNPNVSKHPIYRVLHPPNSEGYEISMCDVIDFSCCQWVQNALSFKKMYSL